jgi:hypothetical protein
MGTDRIRFRVTDEMIIRAYAAAGIPLPDLLSEETVSANLPDVPPGAAGAAHGPAEEVPRG